MKQLIKKLTNIKLLILIVLLISQWALAKQKVVKQKQLDEQTISDAQNTESEDVFPPRMVFSNVQSIESIQNYIKYINQDIWSRDITENTQSKVFLILENTHFPQTVDKKRTQKDIKNYFNKLSIPPPLKKIQQIVVLDTQDNCWIYYSDEVIKCSQPMNTKIQFAEFEIDKQIAHLNNQYFDPTSCSVKGRTPASPMILSVGLIAFTGFVLLSARLFAIFEIVWALHSATAGMTTLLASMLYTEYLQSRCIGKDFQILGLTVISAPSESSESSENYKN